MSVIGVILEKLGIQTQATAYNAGYRDMMAYVRGAQAAAGVIGFEPVDVPAEMLALPKLGAIGESAEEVLTGKNAGIGRVKRSARGQA